MALRAPSDIKALVAAARGGDRAALDELVRVTYRATYTLAYRLTGNEDDARDVVQEAYLRAYRGLRRFRGQAQFTTWLYRITANCAANLLAKRARTSTETLADDAPVVDARVDHDPEQRMAGSPRGPRRYLGRIRLLQPVLGAQADLSPGADAPRRSAQPIWSAGLQQLPGRVAAGCSAALLLCRTSGAAAAG